MLSIKGNESFCAWNLCKIICIHCSGHQST